RHADLPVPSQLCAEEVDVLMRKGPVETLLNNTASIELPAEGFDMKAYIANIEVSLIQNALDKSHGVIAHAAKSLGMQRTTLAEKMRKYHISRPVETSAA
ncbi:MAG TPA: hypothetical protein ENJ64_03450, partial [Thiotrichales bacterium]|nr:hypothetical protein [Thiotrichales bacterium]